VSLLNDVLRDLASRNAPEPIPSVRPVGRASTFRRRPRFVPLGGGMLLAAAAAAGGGWLALRLFSTPAPRPRPSSRVSLPPPVAERARKGPPSTRPGSAPTVPPAAVSIPAVAAVFPHEPPVPHHRAGTSPAPAKALPPQHLSFPPHPDARVAPPRTTPVLAPHPILPRNTAIRPVRRPLRAIERAILRRARAGEERAAWRLARRSAPVRPARHPHYLRLYAGVAAGAGHWREAAHLYSLLRRLEPRSGTVWGGYAVSLLASGHPRRARAAIRRALTLGIPNRALRRYLRRERLLLHSQAPR
jgi:hypothetical protein